VRLSSPFGVGASIAAPALLALLGCSRYVQRGEVLYREHRYIEAAEAFERTEDRLSQSSTEERAEYGLYRGLTFLYLDDVASARLWLGYAYAVVRKAPDTLHREEQTLLDRGWAEVDQRSRTTGVVQVAVNRVAKAEGVPTVRVARAPANGRRAIVPE
jgi:hypothetical protein